MTSQAQVSSPTRRFAMPPLCTTYDQAFERTQVGDIIFLDLSPTQSVGIGIRVPATEDEDADCTHFMSDEDIAEVLRMAEAAKQDDQALLELVTWIQDRTTELRDEYDQRGLTVAGMAKFLKDGNYYDEHLLPIILHTSTCMKQRADFNFVDQMKDSFEMLIPMLNGVDSAFLKELTVPAHLDDLKTTHRLSKRFLTKLSKFENPLRVAVMSHSLRCVPAVCDRPITEETRSKFLSVIKTMASHLHYHDEITQTFAELNDLLKVSGFKCSITTIPQLMEVMKTLDLLGTPVHENILKRVTTMLTTAIWYSTDEGLHAAFDALNDSACCLDHLQRSYLAWQFENDNVNAASILFAFTNMILTQVKRLDDAAPPPPPPTEDMAPPPSPKVKPVESPVAPPTEDMAPPLPSPEVKPVESPVAPPTGDMAPPPPTPAESVQSSPLPPTDEMEPPSPPSIPRKRCLPELTEEVIDLTATDDEDEADNKRLPLRKSAPSKPPASKSQRRK